MDDILTYRVIDSVDDYYNLQRDLTGLEIWSDTWEMKFYPVKCVHLTITNKRTCIKNCYQIYGQNIKQASPTKYLGITIDQLN